MMNFLENIHDYNDRLNYISNFSGSYGFSLILKIRIIYLLMVDTLYKQKIKVEIYFKIITFPKKMPYEILQKKNYIIGFDPKLFY